ncbi:MAG TPA: LON peptidase substrate-binding domain-containing protein [Candidatus Kapabacteria bacterium]|nr:LON peptidase substrate-binding domain-containing protein [Candidatus Kapabacteria bacterium]HRT67282.1 LON peptidase substrate-binding domain-containing protein [Bacteroidota bacterium]
MKKIGILPLGIVLFPESSYPLYIFEDRYKKLINECWDNQELFGINLITPKKMYSIGCTAIVSDIMDVKENGNLDIIISGKQRFKISKIYDGERPYLMAEIEKFEDTDSSIDLELLKKTVNLFNIIAGKAKNFKIKPIEIEKITYTQPSFQIAMKSGLTLEERQYLLEMQSENKRLEYLLNHLNAILPLLEKVEGLELLSRNDGYLNL